MRTVDELDCWLCVTSRWRDSDCGARRWASRLRTRNLASRQGHSVTIVEAGAVLVPQLGLPGRWRLVHDLGERGVATRMSADVIGIREHAVSIRSSDAEDTVKADLVLLASVIDADTGLADALSGSGVEVHAIGDCTGAGFIEGAMLDAAQIAMRL